RRILSSSRHPERSEGSFLLPVILSVAKDPFFRVEEKILRPTAVRMTRRHKSARRIEIDAG
ncbi:MAG: hypothetical protein EBU49_14280, partial [Proteobacteria bacterium]|nr:hypothetical protein [Pseudomonadota bacterium]